MVLPEVHFSQTGSSTCFCPPCWYGFSSCISSSHSTVWKQWESLGFVSYKTMAQTFGVDRDVIFSCLFKNSHLHLLLLLCIFILILILSKLLYQ